MTRQKLVFFILRIFLAFAFLYSALAGYLFPFDWIGYFPNILRNHFPDTLILNLFGLSELIIAGWLIWGRAIFIPSVVAVFYLAGSILFNLGQFNELFRNVPIMGIALALVILSYPRIIPKNKL